MHLLKKKVMLNWLIAVGSIVLVLVLVALFAEPFYQVINWISDIYDQSGIGLKKSTFFKWLLVLLVIVIGLWVWRVKLKQQAEKHRTLMLMGFNKAQLNTFEDKADEIQKNHQVIGVKGILNLLKDNSNQDPLLGELYETFASFDIFRLGNDHRLRHLYRKQTSDFEIALLEHSYRYPKSNRSVYRETVVVFIKNGHLLPLINLRPESFLALNEPPYLDFPPLQGETRTFYLAGDEEASQIVDNTILQHLERDKPIWVEAYNEFLILYRRTETIKNKDLGDFIAFGEQLFQMLVKNNKERMKK